MADEDRGPLLVSFHRDMAEHQILAVARTVATKGAEATEADVDYAFLYRRFDEADLEGSARQAVEDLADRYDDWLRRPVIYAAPGLPDASLALETELRKHVKDGLRARQVRMGPYQKIRADGKKLAADPVIFVVNQIRQSLDGTVEAQDVDVGLFADRLPQQVYLLDMCAHGLMSDAMRDELWRSSDMATWYPNGFRYVYAGDPPFPEVETDDEDFLDAFRSRLETHAATKGIMWSSIPLVFSWFGATGNKMIAALTVLHGVSGGFPNCVLYPAKGPQPADDYRNCRPLMVSARYFRQSTTPPGQRPSRRHATGGGRSSSS